MQGDLEWAKVLPLRAQAGHTRVRYVQSRALRPERTDTDPQDLAKHPRSPSELHLLTWKVDQRTGLCPRQLGG